MTGFYLAPRRGILGTLVVIFALFGAPSLLSAQEQGKVTIKRPEVAFEQLQADVMRYMLRYQSFMSEAFDELIESEKNYGTRKSLQETRLANMTGMLAIAMQPYPDINLLDLIVFVSLTRMVIEDHWAPKVLGGKKGTRLVEQARELESEAWEIARGYLTAEDRAELAELIAAWRAKYPKVRYVESVRFSDFAEEFAESALAQRAKRSFLFSEVSEAATEMRQLRLLGERFLFFFQTLPFTLRDTSRLMTYDLFGDQELLRMMRVTEQASNQFKRFNDIMETMPETLQSQVAVERDALLEGLNKSEKALGALLAQTERSIALGQALVKESQTLASLVDGTTDKLAPLLAGADADPDRDTIAEMQTTLSLASNTVRETEGLLNSVERVLNATRQAGDGPTLIKLFDTAGDEVEEVSDHLFVLAASIILFAVVAMVAGGLAYRYLALRYFPDPRAPSA